MVMAIFVSGGIGHKGNEWSIFQERAWLITIDKMWVFVIL